MLSINLILASFGGGIFGAMISGTGAFIIVGLIGLAGIGIAVSTGDLSVLKNLAFGPTFGPHIAFAGGVAAAAYAGNQKKFLNIGTDINTPLMFTKDPMVLLVGGIFGIFGLFINHLYVTMLIPVDTVALTVVTSGIIARFLFGKSGLTGFKFQSTENSRERYKIVGSEILFDLLIATGMGFAVSFAVMQLGVAEIGFVISAASLIFLYTNPSGGPVTHHLTITAGVAALQTGNPIFGACASIIAYGVFEFLGVRTLNKYHDTHVDSPAVAISITTFIVLNFFPK